MLGSSALRLNLEHPPHTPPIRWGRHHCKYNVYKHNAVLRLKCRTARDYNASRPSLERPPQHTYTGNTRTA